MGKFLTDLQNPCDDDARVIQFGEKLDSFVLLRSLKGKRTLIAMMIKTC